MLLSFRYEGWKHDDLYSLFRSRNLSNNKLREIREGVFDGAGGILELLLTGNKLQAVHGRMFRGLSGLKTLWVESHFYISSLLNLRQGFSFGINTHKEPQNDDIHHPIHLQSSGNMHFSNCWLNIEPAVQISFTGKGEWQAKQNSLIRSKPDFNHAKQILGSWITGSTLSHQRC